MGAIEESCWALVTVTWLILGANGQLGKSLSRVLIDRKIDFQPWGSKELDITSELLIPLFIVFQLIPLSVDKKTPS